MKDTQVKTLLLVGNSPNLVEENNAKSEWKRLLESLEAEFSLYLGEVKRISSFPQRMQAIINLYQMACDLKDVKMQTKIKDRLKEWFEAVSKLLPTAVHRMLYEANFDYYLTTNYDYALDRVFGAKPIIEKIPVECFLKTGNLDKGESIDRHYKVNREIINEGKVVHIHGEVNDLSNIIMTPTNYILATADLANADTNKGSWLDVFCNSEVHICGFNLRTEETVVWHALEKKYKSFREKDLLDTPRTYVYLFYNDDREEDYKDKKALSSLLKLYAVTTILIPVRNNDYISAWKLLLGEMLLTKNRFIMQERGDIEDDTLDNEFIDILGKIERGGGRVGSRGKNLSTAFRSNYKFPYHCLLSLSIKKRSKIAECKQWLIYCKIDGVRYMYRFSYDTLYQLIDSERPTEHLLLNYKTGELTWRKDKDNCIKLGKGEFISNIRNFHQLICLIE